MFVQVIQAKAKDPAGVRKQMEKWRDELMPGAKGFLGSTAGVSPDGEFIALARFESEEAAQRNSDRAEQGQWWSETETYLDDVRFYDCTDVELWVNGGSDDAGFVQVVQGVVASADRQRLSEIDRAFDERLPELRPDIIGGITAWQGDAFSSFNYFTSEAEAREGERREMPPEMQKAFDDWRNSVTDMKFIDLPEPLLISSS